MSFLGDEPKYSREDFVRGVQLPWELCLLLQVERIFQEDPLDDPVRF